MLARRRRALSLLSLVGAGVLVPPAATASAARPAPAVVVAGASQYMPVTPMRIAETRPKEPGYGGFSRLSPTVIRVDVAHRAGVPAGASAAVVTITVAGAVGYTVVTGYPSGTARPPTTSVVADAPGRIVANMATLKLGADGAIELASTAASPLVVDLLGVYVPVGGAVSAGRLETLGGGAQRARDSRDGGRPLAANSTATVDLAPAGLPAGASAAIVNLTAIDASTGYWTVAPSAGARPPVSTLNLDGLWQTRAGQAIVLLNGSTTVNVYSYTGGNFALDLVGWFTGPDAEASTDGLFVPNAPLRLLDTHASRVLAPWAGSTYEFPVVAANSVPVSAAAVNITAVDPWNIGFITAYPAGMPRPLASNVNISTWPQAIGNHAIVRVSTRGVAVFTQGGAHLLGDLSGVYLGPPSEPQSGPPPNPNFLPNRAVTAVVPKIGLRINIQSGPDLNAIANLGLAATWGDLNQVAAPGNVMLFGHRTTHGGPFRNLNALRPGDGFQLVGADGHTYQYVVQDVRVTSPKYSTIAAIARNFGTVTAQLIACSRPDGSPTSLSYRIVVTGRLVSIV